MPDRFATEKVTGRVETFADTRTITDCSQKLELIDVGPNPHTQENIVAYLPKQGILFQGDLFYFDVGDYYPPRNRIRIMTFFASWLKKQGLAPAQVYNVHGRGFATMQQVDQMLMLAR